MSRQTQTVGSGFNFGCGLIIAIVVAIFAIPAGCIVMSCSLSAIGGAVDSADDTEEVAEKADADQAPDFEPAPQAERPKPPAHTGFEMNAEPDPTADPSAEVLDRWDFVGKDDGMNVLLDRHTAVTRRNMIALVRKLAEDEPVIAVRVFSDRMAYLMFKNDAIDKAKARGYILLYVKNETDSGRMAGKNEVLWKQTAGPLEELAGKTESLNQ